MSFPVFHEGFWKGQESSGKVHQSSFPSFPGGIYPGSWKGGKLKWLRRQINVRLRAVRDPRPPALAPPPPPWDLSLALRLLRGDDHRFPGETRLSRSYFLSRGLLASRRPILALLPIVFPYLALAYKWKIWNTLIRRAIPLPRNRKDLRNVTVELPVLDFEILRQLAEDDDRSIGSVIRKAVASFIEHSPRATILKAALSSARTEVPPDTSTEEQEEQS
jgi:hypothetical protein